jgi:hypothetical protein
VVLVIVLVVVVVLGVLVVAVEVEEVVAMEVLVKTDVDDVRPEADNMTSSIAMSPW